MITIEQAANGLTKYLDKEVMPHLPTAKAIALGTVAALYISRAPDMLRELNKNPAFALLAVADDSGSIDIDRIYNAALPQIKGTFELRIPLIGNLTFDKAEADKLYRYIKEG